MLREGNEVFAGMAEVQEQEVISKSCPCYVPTAIISKLSVKRTRVEQHYVRGCCGESKEKKATESSGLAQDRKEPPAAKAGPGWDENSAE